MDIITDFLNIPQEVVLSSSSSRTDDGINTKNSYSRNGIMESRNSIVKLVKKTGNGYVNFARFRNRCMCCMNKDAIPCLSEAQLPIKMNGRKRDHYKK